MKSKFNPPVRDGKPVKCIACGNSLHHKSEHYCSKKCATKMEFESIGDVPAFLSKWKLRNYKEFKDPLSVLRKKTRRKTNDLFKKGIIQKQPCVVCKGVKSPFDSYSFLTRVKRRLDPYICPNTGYEFGQMHEAH